MSAASSRQLNMSPRTIFVNKSAASIKVPISNSISMGAGISTDGVGTNTLTKVSPYGQTLPVYNPDTSYGRSYNLDYGQSCRAKYVEKQLHLTNPHNFANVSDLKPRTLKLSKSEMPLKRIADEIVEDVIANKKRLSPVPINKAISTKPEQFEINHSPIIGSATCKVTKSSYTNEEWLRLQSRERRQKVFLKGEFIPSVSQLQLYGRKEETSRFERFGLWIAKDRYAVN